MKRIQSTKKLLYVSVFAALLVVFLCGILFFQINKSQRLIEQYKEKISNRVNKAERLRSANHLLQNTKEERAKLPSYFVSGEDTVEFIEFIDSLGAESEVSMNVESVKLVDGEEKDPYADLHMSVSAQGDWDSIFRFLSLLELMPYNVDIRDVMINGNLKGERKGSNWSGKISFVVSKLE